MKKRINVNDKVFNKLYSLAVKLNVIGTTQNEKIEKLFNDDILLSNYEEVLTKLNEYNVIISELQGKEIVINEEQSNRLEKLQVLGILSSDLSDTIKTLIDNFTEVKSNEIKEAVLKI